MSSYNASPPKSINRFFPYPGKNSYYHARLEMENIQAFMLIDAQKRAGNLMLMGKDITCTKFINFDKISS